MYIRVDPEIVTDLYGTKENKKRIARIFDIYFLQFKNVSILSTTNLTN